MNFKNEISYNYIDENGTIVDIKEFGDTIEQIPLNDSKQPQTASNLKDQKNQEPQSSKAEEEIINSNLNNNSPQIDVDKQEIPITTEEGQESQIKPIIHGKIKKVRKLSMKMDQAIIEPFSKNIKNVQAFEYFNFEKPFACKYQGNIIFKKEIFIKTTNKFQESMISTEKLNTLGNVIEIRLFSDDPGCEVNLEANLHFKKDSIFMQTILFIAFVLILGNFFFLTKKLFLL